MENQLMMKVISIMVILSISDLSVRGHKQHAANIPAVRRVDSTPHTFDMNLYWYESMHCYAVNGYPCKINPKAFMGHVTCLTKDQVCDGLQQCPYGDDEMGQCGPLAQFCRSDQIRCTNGMCATPCDGKAECPNGMDEQPCNRCGKDELMCSDMKCAKICDGKRECPGGMDERRCLPECKRGEMICPQTGKCAELCDEIAECRGGEDESSCGSKTGQCDLNYISKCIMRSCTKRPPCTTANAIEATVYVVECILEAETKGFPGGKKLSGTRGCGSKTGLVDCLCSGERSCRETFYYYFLPECEF